VEDCTDFCLALRDVSSVLDICTFFYRLYFGGHSTLMITRSIDPAPLPSDNKSTMGPGLAVVGTPGSPSDVLRTKVLLPRPLGDSVRLIVRPRSVAIYWLFNQRHYDHTASRPSSCQLLRCAAPPLPSPLTRPSPPPAALSLRRSAFFSHWLTQSVTLRYVALAYSRGSASFFGRDRADVGGGLVAARVGVVVSVKCFVSVCLCR